MLSPTPTELQMWSRFFAYVQRNPVAAMTLTPVALVAMAALYAPFIWQGMAQQAVNPQRK